MAEPPEFPLCQPLPELPTGGYDDDYFLDPPHESLHCPVCLLVLREPHLISCCGAHICQVCIERIQANEQSCPCCRSDNYINVLNKKERGKVLELKVRCLNSVKGCEWVGELGDQERHFTNKCEYVKEVCRYGCRGKYPRFLLHAHEQDECPERPVEMKMATFTKQIMEKVCTLETKHEREIIDLNKKLTDQEERHKMEKNGLQKQQMEKVCTLETKFNKRMTDQEERHKMEKKELQKQQLQQADEMSQFRRDLSHLIYHVKGEVPEWCYPSVSCLLPPYILTMPNFLQHEKVDDTWFSSPFYTENGGYKLQLAVHANGVGVGIGEGSHVSVFAYLMKSENDDSLKWPFSGDITVQLLNWREDKGHVEVILNNTTPDCCNRVTKGERAVSAMRYRQFISHDNVEYNPDKNTQYVHNDTMCFRISKVSFPTGQDVPSWYIPTPVTEFPYLLPPCTITMYNYSEHKRVGDTWVSTPFYTGPDGYKLKLLVYANGYSTGTGTHVGVSVRLMKGENDKSLKWPFNSEITLHLLNWREEKEHVEKTINHYMGEIKYRSRVTQGDIATIGLGIPHFISHSDLEYNANYNTEYINNDKLCFVISKIIIH